jgi:tungstate transport system substrate-binding protein
MESDAMFKRGAFPIALWLAFGFLAAIQPQSRAAERPLMLASTTSTQNSGLFAHLLPLFEAASGIKTRVIAVGTGQALRLARSGDADILLVHDAQAEKAFVAKGYGTVRRAIMYNDFVLLGPVGDPAGVRGMIDIRAALRAISARRALFISRGDDSGTHRAERRQWKSAGIDIAAASSTWYREAGSGMGATLNIASGLNAYVLADRATWLSFRNKGDLAIVLEGDARLFNQYGVIAVNPERHPHVNAAGARKLAQWLSAPAGQQAIAAFRVNGQQLFFPNYAPGS